MGAPVDFNKEGIVYGLLYRFGDNWVMNFYTSARGRQIGLSSVKRYSQMIMKFQLTLKAVANISDYVPVVSNFNDRSVPQDHIKYLIEGNTGKKRGNYGS